ncbi:MAG: 50S ribosomal protein L10 [Phycisphaerales bacterium]|nr:50S ribosomal protein L10 [Phycisphaerales bacterium]
MSKSTKDCITSDYSRSYSGLADACLVDVTKLNVQDVTRFRQELRKKQIRVQVVKNSLARRAFAGTKLLPLAEALSGPCALVTGGDSIIDVARALMDAKKTYATLELKHAILEGDPGLLTVEELSKLRGRREMLGEIAMLISSPGRKVAGCLKSAGGKIAGCLKTLADKPEEAAAAA